MKSETIKIIYEDSSLLVCHKPPGLAVQSAGLGTMDMESLLRRHLADTGTAAGENGIPYLGMIHRLDQPVEGLLVFAKTPEAAASLSRQAQGKDMGKEYLALVRPTKEGLSFLEKLPRGGEKRLEDFLVKDGRMHMSRIALAGEKGAKKAVLFLSVEEEPGDEALLHIRLETGRHHQIRVQLSNAGLPIVGDRKYGAVEPQADPQPAGGKTEDRMKNLRFPALCAYRLSFTHPKTGKRMEFELERSGIGFMKMCMGNETG